MTGVTMTAGATLSGIALPDNAVQRFARSRLVDEVTSYLRELIISGELEPGTLLPQIDLATKLGVSRTPLREAFRVLERDGLIRVGNGNKTVEVATLTASDLVDIFQIREVLDGLAARLCADGRFTDAVRTDLRTQMDALEAAADSNDLTEYGARHADFHLILFRASGNLRLADEAPIVRISSQVPMIRYMRAHREDTTGGGEGTTGVLAVRATPASTATVATSSANNGQRNFEDMVRRLLVIGNDDHENILSCLEHGDPEAAEAAARFHMRKSAETMARYVANS